MAELQSTGGIFGRPFRGLQSYIQANCPTASIDATDYLAMMADVGIDHQKLPECQYVNIPVTVNVNDDVDANVQ